MRMLPHDPDESPAADASPTRGRPTRRTAPLARRRVRERGSKLARQMHLLQALLASHRGLTFAEITADVAGYVIEPRLRHATTAEARQAFAAVRRTFERDKDELRLQGLPLEMVQLPGDEDTPGSKSTYLYRLRREAFYMPYLSVIEAGGGRRPPRRLTGREYARLGDLPVGAAALEAVVAGAVRAISLGDLQLADAARRALRALSLDLPVESIRETLTPLVGAPAQAIRPDLFDALDEAVAQRQAVRVSYRGMRDAAARERTLHPLGLFLVGAHWYLAALDAEGGATLVKNFRLSRIDAVTPTGPTGAVRTPEGFRLPDHARQRQPWELGDHDVQLVDVHFRGTTGAVLAARAKGAPVAGLPDDVRRFAVRRVEPFLRWVLALAPQARILAPDALAVELAALAQATLAHHDRSH